MKRFILMIFMLLLPFAACANETLYPARGDNGLYGYIDASGAWRIAPQYDYAGNFRGDYAAAGIWDAGEGWENHTGIIDRSGAFVVPPEYSLDAGYYGDYFGGKDTGIYLLYKEESDDGNMGFFDVPSGYFSGLMWKEVWCWLNDDSPLIAVSLGAGFAYVERSTGRLVTPYCWYGVNPSAFSEGVAAVGFSWDGMWEERWLLIDQQGQEIPLPEGITVNYAAEAREGRIQVSDQAGALFGYADLQGHVVIEPQYCYAGDFHEGLACVCFLEGDYGAIDLDGNVVFRGITDTLYGGFDFAQGVAVIRGSKAERFIDQAGNALFTLPEGVHCGNFMPNGLARVSDEKHPEYFGWINRTGEMVIPIQWRLDELDSGCFIEGLQAVKTDGLWGYIDETGEIVIPLQFLYADSFNGALAYVETETHSGYIDKAGNFVYTWEDGKEYE